MSYGYHCGLVTAPRANSGEVRMQGMDGKARMMRRLAEHRTQLRRSALGNVSVRVTLAGLKGTWDQTGVAGGVLGTLEATDLGKDCNRSERDDRTDTWNRFQSFHCIAPLACGVTETVVERADLLGCLSPHGIVMTHMVLELFGDEIAREQALPVRVGAQATAPPAVSSDSAQQPFHRVNLGGLDANEVAPAR